MFGELFKFLPLINFAPDDEAGGGDTSNDTDENGDTAEDRIRKVTDPEETTLYNKDGSGREPDADVKDTGAGADEDEGDGDDGEGGDNKDDDEAEKEEDDNIDLDTVPEDGKYKIELPEGMERDEELQSEMEVLWKEKGLTHKEAQKIADKYIEGLAKQADASEQTRENTVNKWYEETTKDKDFGGDNLDKNLALGGKALDAYGDDGLRELMKSTGVGNNLSMLRFMAKVGATVADDDVPDENNPQPNMSKPGDEVLLYGATTPTTRE